jgi:hypothetical protein
MAGRAGGVSKHSEVHGSRADFAGACLEGGAPELGCNHETLK